MAYATKTTPIANILLDNSETWATMIAKINKNETTLASTVDSVYNNLYFNPSTKVIGDQSSISLVNTQNVTIDIPQASKSGKGINFSLNGLSKGSILTDANGDTIAAFKTLTVTDAITAGSLSLISVASTSGTITNTLSTGTLSLTSGGIKSLNPTEVVLPVTSDSPIGTNTVTLSNILLNTPSNKSYSAVLTANATIVNIVVPVFVQDKTQLDGYEFTVMLKNSGSSINSNSVVSLSYADGIINTNAATYQIGTTFAANTTKVVTFRFVGSKIVVKSVA